MKLLLITNIRLILRDRQTLFWALVFPLIFVIVFGLLDIGNGPTSVTGVIIDQANTDLSHTIANQVTNLDFVKLKTDLTTVDDARKSLENGDIGFVLVLPPDLANVGHTASPVGVQVFYDPANAISNQAILGALNQITDGINLAATGQPNILAVAPQSVTGQNINYFDIVLVGLVGMALMFNSIITIAVKLSMYRDQNVFKRLLATPLQVSRFFAAFIVAHMLLALVQVGVVLLVGIYVFGGVVHGNVAWLVLIAVISNIIFLNIGFIVGGYSKGPAAASGLGNVIAMPMMFFSGVFFPTDSLPAFLPKVVQILPLTPLINVLRSVALDAKSPLVDPGSLALLGGWIVVSSVLAIRLFKFR